MTKGILIPLIEKGLSTYKIAKELKVSSSTIIYWIKYLNLSDLYKSVSINGQFKKTIDSKYTKEILEKIVRESNSLTEVIEKLKNVPRGRNFDTIKKYIKLYNLDISHFYKNNRKIMSKCASIDDYLILDSKIGSNRLKQLLYKNKLKKRECELCGQDKFWNGKQLSLILDHINGKHNDNRIENLRIVCPNCNATLDTHCGKNINHKN
jgi:transposase